MPYSIHTILTRGSRGLMIEVECHLSNNLPTIIIVGFANKAVDEARERIRGAFASSRIMLPRKRITVNLAPADIPKADSGFDLAIAVAILAASGEITRSLPANSVFIGELGLDGTTRAVRGLIGKLMFGRAHGITTFYIPAANIDQGRLVPGVTLLPIHSLGQLHAWLSGLGGIAPVNTGAGQLPPATSAVTAASFTPLSAIVGQKTAKRALKIAAAGGHNLFFEGPPGTGKSLLAQALVGLLPPLTQEEMLAVTQLHSLSGHDYGHIVQQRPFRAPHHSASHVAMVGGGSQLRPGEISLAHHGVLFLDELPEFSRETIEALRQPLESRMISLARARETAEFPANFMLVATANPCPCGYAPDPRCLCPAYSVDRYRARISGPILDRIDLYSFVGSVDHRSLLATNADEVADQQAQRQVTQARQRQHQRLQSSQTLNANMSSAQLKTLSKLSRSAIQELNRIASVAQLSARGYFRTIKVARTIADLEAEPIVLPEHIAEAFSFRYKSPVRRQD